MSSAIKGEKKKYDIQKTDQGQLIKENRLKKLYFSLASLTLKEATNISPIIFYFSLFIQFLSLIWFLIHPILNIYHQNAILYTQIIQSLEILNFSQFLGKGISYKVMVPFILAFYSILAVVTFITTSRVIQNKRNQMDIILNKFICRFFLVVQYILGGPIIGLGIYVLICNTESPYHVGQQCYTPQHILFCLLAIVMLIMTILPLISSALIIYSRNPFNGHFFGFPNRNYLFSKIIIKIIFPLYFALNSSLKLQFLYIVASPIIWGLYIFYHRINNIRSFKQIHFKVEYFLQSFLFCLSLINAIIYYVNGQLNSEPLVLIYVLICSLFGALILLHIENYLHRCFFQDLFQGKISKKNFDKVLLILISKLIHVSSNSGKIELKGLSHIISGPFFGLSKEIQMDAYSSNIQNFELIIESKDAESDKNMNERQTKKKVYLFLLNIINHYMKDSKIPDIKLVKCHLLRLLGQNYSSLHELLQLKQQKLSFSDEFAVFDFLHSYKLQEDTKGSIFDKKTQLSTMYHYQEITAQMEEIMDECAENNLEYWDQLCQTDPSLPKLRNLSTKYIQLTSYIASSYEKLKTMLPDSCSLVSNYLHFLLQVGVNLPETIKIRQQLKLNMEKYSCQRALLGGLDVDDIGMIALDSVGSTLGHIVNCNRNVKNMLGYEKNNLMSRNITRIMPKIYSELHNNFILDYIKGQNVNNNAEDSEKSNKRITGQKLVTPLNIDNLLVEVSLTLHIYSNVSSSLILMGFMNKIQAYKEGLLMINNTTGVILAIDSELSLMLKNKITGTQVVQEQIKVSSILPEINLEQFDRKPQIQTILEVGQVTNEEENLSMQVIVTIKRTKLYQNQQISFLSVVDKNKSPVRKRVLSWDKEKKRFNHIQKNNQKRITTIENMSNVQINFDSKKKSLIQSRAFSSIASSEVKSCIDNENKNQLSHYVSLNNKLNSFIEINEGRRFNIYMKICYIMIFICLTIYLVTAFCLRNNYLTRSESMYKTMQDMSIIPYQQAQINLYTNLLWCVPMYHFFSRNLSQYKLLEVVTNQLETTYAKVVQDTLHQQYPLKYNENTLYNFKTFKLVGRTQVPQTLPMNYRSGIQNYINSAKIMQNYSLLVYMSSINRLFVQKQAYYITVNGDQLVPQIAINATDSYKRYFAIISQHQKIQAFCIKSGLILLTILCLVGVILLGRALNNAQRQVFQFHSKLRLWDITQLANKCQYFLKNRGKNMKRRNSSYSLKVFPMKTFMSLLQCDKKKGHQADKIIKKQSAQEESIHLLHQQQQSNDKDKDKSIQIEWHESHKRALSIILLIVILALIILVISMYFQFKTAEQLSNQFSFIQQIGIIRKTLTYLDYYVSRMMAIHPAPIYATMIGPEAKKFYELSSLTFEQLGNPVFSDVYATVQMVQAYFGSPDGYTAKYSKEFLTNAYDNIIKVSIQNACHKISALDRTIYEPRFSSVVKKDKQTEIVLTCLLWFLGILLVVLFHMIYFAPLFAQRCQTINMLRLLPCWVIERSSAREFLFK